MLYSQESNNTTPRFQPPNGGLGGYIHDTLDIKILLKKNLFFFGGSSTEKQEKRNYKKNNIKIYYKRD